MINTIYNTKNNEFLQKEIINEINDKKLVLEDDLNISNVLDKEILIILTISSNYETTKRCIDNILKQTPIKFQLVLINNNSSEEHISKLITDYKIFQNIKIINNNKKLIENINSCISNTDNDVILLNTNIIVVPRWIQKVILVAYSNPKIGIVSFIYPQIFNELNVRNYDNNQINRINSFSLALEKISKYENVIAPSVVNSCLFIKRNVISDVGTLDENNYDNLLSTLVDFTIRSKNNGWNTIYNNSIFLFNNQHYQNLEKLEDNISDNLLKMYPNIKSELETFKNHVKDMQTSTNVSFDFEDSDNNLIKNNILYIASSKNNMPEIDGVHNLTNRFNLFILTFENSEIKLWFVNNGELIYIYSLQTNINSNKFIIEKDFLVLLNLFHIEFLFINLESYLSFLKNNTYTSLIQSSSKLSIPIFYGKYSEEFIEAILNNKNNFNHIIDRQTIDNYTGVVYTAIFDDNNKKLLNPKYISPNLDYICFTDNPKLKSSVWDIHLIDDFPDDIDNKETFIKTFPHKYLNNYDYSVWIDADFQILGNLHEYISKYSMGRSMLCPLYLDNDCIYNELSKYEPNKENSEIIKNKLIQFEEEGFPENYGMFDTSVIFRKHNNPNLIKLMEEWYGEITISKQLELCLPYLIWKNRFEIDTAKILYLKNNYFECYSNPKQKLSDKIHIFLINNEKIFIENTIKSVKSIDNNIPITLIDLENTAISHTNYVDSEIKINEINDYLKNISEDLIIFLYSGDLITKDLTEYINKLNSHFLSDIGAIVFDEKNYYSVNNLENFKPNFSYDFYLEHDYIKNAVVFNKNSVLSVEGFDLRFKDNLIRDMIIKLNLNGLNILKEDIIGFKLNSTSKNSSEDEEFLSKLINENKINAEIIEHPNFKPIYKTFDKKASIIIPFKDQANVTKKCIESILNKTIYQNYEIILVNNNSREDETQLFIDEYKNNPKITFIEYNDIFNYSKLNNFATEFANGDVYIFLNNDTEVISENWLNLLIGDAIQEDVGVVGAKLYYPDFTIQHLGVVIGLNGLAGHLFNGEKEENIPEYFINCRRNVSAVTGACMAIEKKIFDEINGFDELFDITGSDVEICLRLLNLGYRNIINPDIQLIHHEKKTRSRIRVRDIDIQLSIEYYGPYLRNGDPFFNKHYSLNSTRLILKKVDEVPKFKEFLDDYFKQKNMEQNKLENIIKTKKSIKNVKFDREVLEFDVTPSELVENAILMNNFFKNPILELDTVMWFLPWFDLIYRGGIYTIFRIANYFSLKENTHNIFVLKGGNKRDMNSLINDIKIAFPNLNFEVIDLDKLENVSDLPKSDAAFCTYWTTAYSLVKYNKCKAKFYLNQDYEPLFAAAGSVFGLIEETYRFKFIGLANSKGVGDKYKNYDNVVKYFTPAVDKTVYYPHIRKEPKKKVVFYGRPTNPRNGFILGIEALKIVKSYFGDDVEIFSAGAEFDLNEYGLEGVITNLGLLDSVEKVADLYRHCDVGLVFMFTPHPSYQPLEYMACGCATVTNINESNLWLLKDKENAILTEPVVSCVAENIINLLNDDYMRNNIIYNGIRTIQQFDWENVLDDIVDFVKNPLK